MSSAKPVFSKIDYDALDARQKEVHNFHHIAAILAKHGFASYPIRDDWNGGDMIARHMTDVGKGILTIQIKSRLTFAAKYQGKDLWVGFPFKESIYVFPHDEMLAVYDDARKLKGQPSITDTEAWKKDGQYSWDKPTTELRQLLEPYRLNP